MKGVGAGPYILSGVTPLIERTILTFTTFLRSSINDLPATHPRDGVRTAIINLIPYMKVPHRIVAQILNLHVYKDRDKDTDQCQWQSKT